MITDDMAEAVEGAKLILVCIPSVAHEVFFEKLAPLLKDGMIVHIIPDNYGSLRLRKHLRAIGNEVPWMTSKSSTLALWKASGLYAGEGLNLITVS